MRIIRRIGVAAMAAMLMSAFVSGPAAADTPETYVGTAAGKALHLSVFGDGDGGSVTLGGSFAEIDSTLHAAAAGTGFAGIGETEAAAEVTGNNTSQSVPQACGTDQLEPVLSNLASLITLGAGCGSAAVQVVNGLPVAHGEGTVANVDLDLQTVLGELPIGDVVDGLEPVFGGLDQVFDEIEAGGGPALALTDTVKDLLTALGSTRTLEVRLGASTSDVTTVGERVTSTGAAAGGVISILPLGAIGEKPVAEIEIGSANATAVYDRATGVSTPSFDPALVTIRLNTPTTDALGEATGIDFQEIVISPADLVNLPADVACDEDAKSVCILKGTPFETRITVASGHTVTNPDGTVGAVADAVAVHALRNIGELDPALAGGILLEVAHAEAGVGGKPAQIVEITPPDLPRELPRTGGFAILPMLGGTGLAAAILGRRYLSVVRSS